MQCSHSMWDNGHFPIVKKKERKKKRKKIRFHHIDLTSTLALKSLVD